MNKFALFYLNCFKYHAYGRFLMNLNHIFFFITHIIYVCLRVTTGHVFRSQDNFHKLILFFYSVNSRDGNQVTRPGWECLFPRSHLTGPEWHFNRIFQKTLNNFLACLILYQTISKNELVYNCLSPHHLHYELACLNRENSEFYTSPLPVLRKGAGKAPLE